MSRHPSITGTHPDVAALITEAFDTGVRHRLLWLVAFFTLHGIEIMGEKPTDSEMKTEIDSLVRQLNDRLDEAQVHGLTVTIGVEERPVLSRPDPMRNIRLMLARPVT